VENLLVARWEGRIVAHVGICLRDATLLGASVRVASIGAVATDPAHRGHGSATQLMTRACEQAVRQGASLMLISGLRGLYRRLGYVQVGDFRGYLVPAGPDDSALTVAVLQSAELSDVIRLHQQEPVRFLRSRDDWERLLGAGMLMNHAADLLLIREAGVAVAYAGVQRPGPPQDPGRPVLVKEFAGSREALARALPGIAARYRAPAVEVIASGADTAWQGAAASWEWRGSPLPFPGTLCIIDVPRFLRAVQPLVTERVGDALRIEPEGVGVRLEAAGETAVLETASQLTALLFGGEADDARAVPALPPAIREVVDAALPLPLLWYGYNYV
jgi:predicted N-acetyltransferase YhbS